VLALEAAADTARADRAALSASYESRVRTLEQALEQARRAPDEVINGLRATMASTQAEGASARAALAQALGALEAENTRLQARVNVAEAATAAAIERAAAEAAELASRAPSSLILNDASPQVCHRHSAPPSLCQCASRFLHAEPCWARTARV
jgi:hypothetical protein